MSQALSLRALAACLCGMALASCTGASAVCGGDAECGGDGRLCDTDGVCRDVCRVTRGDGTTGSPCNDGFDCDSGSCDNEQREASCECLAGTVDPCSLPLPTAAEPSLDVGVYAVFRDTRQGGISFASDKTLYAGNLGPEGSSDTDQIPLLRVDANAMVVDMIGLVRDPDVVIVDTNPTVASAANNIFAGGQNLAGDGQLTEIAGDGMTVDEVVQPCVGNVNVMLFLQDGRLLFSNFDTPNVCVATRDQDAIAVTELISTLEGDAPAGGLAQDPATGDLFITTAGTVRRYGLDGVLKDASYYSGGTAVGYGPAGSAFEGLLLRRGARLDLRSDVEDADSDVILLNGQIGSFIAFYPNDATADLYISDINPRILRVSRSPVEDTEAGCL